MKKIVVRTKFNKTGKRILTIPLDNRRVCAPAHHLYREARHAAEEEWRRKYDFVKRTYIESMAHRIASYVARDSTPIAEKYRTAKFLAEQSLAERGAMNVKGPGSSRRWSIQLGNVPELASIEEEAWEAHVVACRKADAERDAAIAKARTDCDDMKRALSREISDHIHRQYHQEDTH